MTRLKQALSVGAWGGLFDCPSSNLICGFIHWTESGCENDWTDIIWPEISSLSLCIFLHSFPSFPSSYTHTKTHLAFNPTMRTPPLPFLRGNRRRVLGHKLPQSVQPWVMVLFKTAAINNMHILLQYKLLDWLAENPLSINKQWAWLVFSYK